MVCLNCGIINKNNNEIDLQWNVQSHHKFMSNLAKDQKRDERREICEKCFDFLLRDPEAMRLRGIPIGKLELDHWGNLLDNYFSYQNNNDTNKLLEKIIELSKRNNELLEENNDLQKKLIEIKLKDKTSQSDLGENILQFEELSADDFNLKE